MGIQFSVWREERAVQLTITENFHSILAEWREAFFATYGAADFLRRKTDPFANPVGSTISRCIEEILQHLRTNSAIEAFHTPLDGIIRIRAVQEFTPSQALAPFFAIRPLLAQHAEKERRTLAAADWSLVDNLLLLTFDIYMACREQLYQTKLKEMTSGNRLIIKKAVCPSTFLKQPGQSDGAEKTFI